MQVSCGTSLASSRIPAEKFESVYCHAICVLIFNLIKIAILETVNRVQKHLDLFKSKSEAKYVIVW